ncbi:START domain-containing protein 10 [Brachionichthys hirsutus]|uniref:START domain-containing protein 10 n=1 Tax=Brachionichthys hirsutus TaxID=412623 RepID=UPI0036046797
MSGQAVTIPDDRAFASFKAECLCEEGWSMTCSKRNVTVWVQDLEEGKSIHRIKCLMVCKDISAETMYDVLHDIEYRRKWDKNVYETFDIGKLTVNTDVGYYAWKCPGPLRNRDVVTLRSWLPIGKDYIIMNYSVKHAKYPPKKDLVRAVSIQTGYMVQCQGPKHCILTYMAHVDPRGSLPKWVFNKSSHIFAPRAMMKINKACLKYSDWKQRNNPGFKPWLYPEQTTLPSIPLSELSIQRAESLEIIDESSLAETQERDDSD